MEKLRKQRIMTHEEFCTKVKENNPSYLDFDIISKYQKSSSSIKCRCHVCKNEWETTASCLIHPKGRASGCPYCAQSKGEAITARFLTQNEIEFERQKQYDGLCGVKGHPLSYDFYIPKVNLLIEIQGTQHFEKVKYFGGDEKFKIQQEHDNRKREYAHKHDIDLLEIQYRSANDLGKIEKILSERLLDVSAA